MSDTPDIPSNQWGGLPRICTWGHFRTSEGIVFAFYNTHLDNRLMVNRIRGVRLILDRMTQQSGNIPNILVGDFNMSPKESGYDLACTALTDVFAHSPYNRSADEITYHEFTGAVNKSWRKPIIQWIDYIFISNGIKIQGAQRIIEINSDPKLKYASDHWHLLAELELEPN
jgi:endonuclease/exonuclease/phosphatase family metal-dependent hydrolase